MSVDSILSTVRRKHASNEWRIDHRPDRDRWETYRIPQDWPFDLYQWLHQTFGVPNNTTWEYHGGWIYFYKEECVSTFLLRWS